MISNTDLSYAIPAMHAYVSFSLPSFRRVVGGALEEGLKKIPILGQPLTMIKGFFDLAMKSGNNKEENENGNIIYKAGNKYKFLQKFVEIILISFF